MSSDTKNSSILLQKRESRLTLKRAILKNSSEPKFRNQILLGLKHSAVITLPILSSLRQKGRLTPKLVVRSNRCRGQSAWQSSAWSLTLLSLMFPSLLVEPSESFQPGRGGEGTAPAEEREDKTKTVLLCFMILVIAVRKRVYRVERKRRQGGRMEKGKGMMLHPCGILGQSPKRFTLKPQMHQRPRVYPLSLLCQRGIKRTCSTTPPVRRY